MFGSTFNSSLVTSPFFFLLVIIDLVLRGIALFKSARRDEKIWFVALLVINTVGVLPLIYLFLKGDVSAFFQQTGSAPKKTSRRRRK